MKDETINIYTHTQVGDHMICYGFIKEYAKEYSRVVTFTNNWTGPQHIANVKRLFSTIPNVTVIVGDPIFLAPSDLMIGQRNWEPALRANPNIIFDQYFYSEAKKPFNLKWDNFYIERDLAKEKKIFDDLGLVENEYIFMHEDIPRNYFINKEHIDPNIKKVEPSKLQNVSILDMLYIIEKAKEVHVINSSFLTFIDLVQIQRDNLFYHKYVRPECQPTLKLNWKVYEL